MTARPGVCTRCSVRYADSLFNVEKYIKANKAGNIYISKKTGIALKAVETQSRELYKKYLTAEGFIECLEVGCERALKLKEEEEC